MKLISGFALLVFFSTPVYAADLPVGRVERSQELIENDKLLMEKLNTEEKVFVKNILLKGDNSISPDVLAKITAPFLGRWLTNLDMAQIVELIVAEYRGRGRDIELNDFLCKVDNGTLEIIVPGSH